MKTSDALQMLTVDHSQPFVRSTEWRDAIKDHPYTTGAHHGHVSMLVKLRECAVSGTRCSFPGVLMQVTENLGRVTLLYGKDAVEAELDRLRALKAAHDAHVSAIYKNHGATTQRISALVDADPEYVQAVAAGHILWAALHESEEAHEEARGLRAEAGMAPGPHHSEYERYARHMLKDAKAARELVVGYFETPRDYDLNGTLRDVIGRMIGSGRDWPRKGWELAQARGIEALE